MDKLLAQLKDRWFILAFIVTFSIWYATTNARLDAVEAKQVEQASIQQDVTQLKIDMAVVKDNVIDIKAILTK